MFNSVLKNIPIYLQDHMYNYFAQSKKKYLLTDLFPVTCEFDIQTK